MSVAEFVIALSVSLPMVLTAHELTRLYAVKHVAQIELHQSLSRASLSALFHINKKSFSSSDQKANPFEKMFVKKLGQKLSHDFLNWQWISDQNSHHKSINSIRVSATGPTSESPAQPIRLSLNICVKSWLEPLMKIASDGRTCLGEFSSAGKSRGITLHIEGQRETSVHIPVYFFGLYLDAKK